MQAPGQRLPATAICITVFDIAANIGRDSTGTPAAPA